VDPFLVVMFGLGVVFVLGILALGKWYPGSGADVLDWKPTRSPELEAELEVSDLDQMLEAQNERRRRRGERELTLEDFELRVAQDMQEDRRRRAEYLREQEGAAAEEDTRQMEALLEEKRRARRERG
jgi:hypothetical protein